ncbi:hypothetical protein [Scytonema sp. PCC 10023]|uniref:hypothetical protein n=1 Tax=Scytonema sp. PCC 10023 TaxID=1680591 RepID=UPI0039C689CF
MNHRVLPSEQDAETLTSTSGGTYRNNLFQTIDVKVELRKSNKCQANWVKAYVPKDTSLYLKDQSGNQRNFSHKGDRTP